MKKYVVALVLINSTEIQLITDLVEAVSSDEAFGIAYTQNIEKDYSLLLFSTTCVSDEEEK